MINRFDQLEKRLEDKREAALSPNRPDVSQSLRESTAKKDMVVSVKKIQRIEETFTQGF